MVSRNTAGMLCFLSFFMSRFARFFWLLLVFVALTGPGSGMAGEKGPGRFQQVGMEMKWSWGGAPLKFGAQMTKGGTISVTRVDFLVSGLSLRREDGSWLETGGWFACFKGADGLSQALLEGVPAQVYTGLRFKVGVEPEVDQGDPNRWPAGHALHPLVNGLHWGWQGGYIFMAMEGHWPQSGGEPGGFSYHLAGEQSLMAVTLEGRLDLRSGGTVGLDLDVAKVLGGLDPAVFGESTHSREGDPRAATLRIRVEQAFRLTGVKPEVWQDPVVVSAPSSTAAHGTPYPLQFSRRLPQVKLPPDNRPTLEGVNLGRALFHDPRLSVNNTQSCASCHDRRAAFADAGKRFSLGADGLPGKRNAMPLFNLAWQAEFFWDGRTRRLRDQVLEPIQDPLEMHQPLDQAVGKLAADPAYPGEFEAAFGTAGITAERLGLALEQFLLTQVSQDSKFDQALRGTTKLTAVEQRGLELFVTEHDPARNLRGADCFHCHGGALFSNQGFANNGLDAAPLPGRQAVTGLGSDAGKFRVPPLRNIAVTGPYMHDGRFATLAEVIDHYDHGVHRTATLDPNLAKHPAAGLGLGAADKAALIAFLHTLTDQAFLRQGSISAASLSKP